MDTYLILRQVNFQGLRCVTHTLWLTDLLWQFLETKSKTGTKTFWTHFGNISLMTVRVPRFSFTYYPISLVITFILPSLIL